MATAEAKALIDGYLESIGQGKKTINYKLRDWLFSRQRYWGEPFPILLGEGESVHGRARVELPVRLPELDDFRPSGRPEPPLGKATEWVRYSDAFRRETNTMPQWAGSCWYYLRYIDPKNDEQPWSTPSWRSTGCRWTCTSAGPSTRSCTCSTAGSGTRCCSIGGWSARRSRSRSW